MFFYPMQPFYGHLRIFVKNPGESGLKNTFR